MLASLLAATALICKATKPKTAILSSINATNTSTSPTPF
jgi:hypothetical protein